MVNAMGRPNIYSVLGGWKDVNSFAIYKIAPSVMTSAASEEYRRKMVGYDLEKKEWEDYVDSKWDAAFDDAFGVKQFAEFLGKVTEIGEGVIKVNVGDYCAVGCMVDACLDCKYCNRGDE
jgi:hypothetical protein